MAPAGRSSQVSQPHLPFQKQPSLDLTRSQSLQSEKPSRNVKAESRHTLDDTDFDQFWVTTDEESDGEVPWKKGHGSRRMLTVVEGSLSRGPSNEVAVPRKHEQPSHATNSFAPQRGPNSHNSVTSQINQDLSRPVAANGNPNPADAMYHRQVASSRGSGAGVVDRSSEFEEYEMSVAKLREFERQAGVDCPLEGKAAGVLVMQVQAKVAKLGLEDGRQRTQITMCILEAEVARAHASATLSEWDGVGQGLRKLVTEKDAELQVLRASAAEQKCLQKLAESSQAIAQDAEVSRQEAKSKAAEVEKLVVERNQLRVALSDAEMELQSASSLMGQMKHEQKQGLGENKENERAEEQGQAKKQKAMLRLQEKLQAAEEVNRVNQGVVRGLEEQLRVVKDGWVKERGQWVKDAIAQQSAIMEHIKDRETYAKTKEREIKKLGLGLETVRKTAEVQSDEMKRKDAEIASLAAKLESREKERGQLVGLREEQTTAQAATIAGLEDQVRKQTQIVISLQEKTKAQSAMITGLEERVKEHSGVEGEIEMVRAQLEASHKLVESLKDQVVSLENETRMVESREANLRVSNGAHETRAAQVAVGLAELTSRMNGLESEKAKLRSALEASENKRQELSAERETFVTQLKERESLVAAVKAEVEKLTEDAESKLHIAVAEKESELLGQIAGLEGKISELETRAERSLAENGYSLGVSEGRADQQGRQERLRSFERYDSLGGEGQEVVGAHHRRDYSQGSQELQASNGRTSKEAGALSAELRVAKEERDKLLLRTEFLRKKVGELKEQNGLLTEQAAATAHSHHAELSRSRAEADAANRRVELLSKTCRGLQAQLNHVAADVANTGGSPTKRKRTRVDSEENLESTEGGVEDLQSGSGGVKAGLNARVVALEKVIGEKDWALAGKSRELQAKESEVRGLQEILRVLARQLEEAEGTPRKDVGRESNESGANMTPTKMSQSWSVDGSVLSAVKNALRGSMSLVGTPRNSLEVARAVGSRGEPLNGSPLVASVSRERVALKREIRELYDRLERKEEDLEEQTREYRAAEQEALATWREKEDELVKDLEGKALKLGVMEEAFQELVTKLEEARAELDAAAEGALVAEKRAGEAEHAQLMTKRRLEKLEELDKKGDGLWKEMARLAAANASLEDQIAQMTSAPTQITHPEFDPASDPRSVGDAFERQRGAWNGATEGGLTSPTQASAAFIGGSAQTAGDQLEGERTFPSKAASLGIAGETPLEHTASGTPDHVTKGHVAPHEFPSPSGQSEGASLGSASALPATSPNSDAQKAQTLSESVFDRMAILRQRYSTDGAPDTPGASPRAALSFYHPDNQSLPVSPAGSSGRSTPSATTPSAAGFHSPRSGMPPALPPGKSARSQDETPKETKSGGGIRNLVRWLDTKVSSRKSSASSSPEATPSGYVFHTGDLSTEEQRSPGSEQLGDKVLGAITSPPARDMSQPGALRGPARGAVNWKMFARELPRLELPADVPEISGAKKSISPDVRARLEILRQRSFQSQSDDSRGTEPTEGDPSAKKQSSPVPSPRPRILLDGSNASDAGSFASSERTGSLRRGERVSAGFGSPQANGVPAILSWIPPLEALGGGNRTPRLGERTKHGSDVGRSVEKPGDPTKGGSGRWDDAQGAVPGGLDSPSSVLERLAMLRARGNAPSSPAAT